MTLTTTTRPEVSRPASWRRRHRWRLLAGSALAAAAGALAMGLAFAFLSATGSNFGTGNSAQTGSVALTVNGPPATHACNYTNPPMAPGTSLASCALSVTYSGLPAYLSLSVLVETQPGSGGRSLYSPPKTNGLGVSLKDNQSSPVTYTAPTASTTCPTATTVPWKAAAPAHSACYELDNELVATSAFTATTTVVFTLTPTFPKDVGDKDQNAYQGGAAQVLLAVNAVQSAANTPPSCSSTAPSVSPPTAGKPCTATGSFSWS